MWQPEIINTTPILHSPLYSHFCENCPYTKVSDALECTLLVYMHMIKHCNQAIQIEPSLSTSVHLHTAVCVFMPLCLAGGKQCGLSWGRGRLKVPGEDVILSDSAHRDRQTHRRLTHSLCLIDLNAMNIVMNCSGSPQHFHPLITL